MPEFKICTICKIQKTADNFNRKSTSKDGLQNVCRGCNSRRTKLHYEKNSEKIKQRTAVRKKVQKKILRDYIWSLLETNGCIDCGEKDPIVLEFDHRNNKLNSVSRLIMNAVHLNVLKSEIEKCDIRCANCHKRKTAKDFNWWRVNR